MNLPSIKEIITQARDAFQRFPITLSWAVLGSLFGLYIIEYKPTSLFEEHGGTVLTLIMGIGWLLGTQFFVEQTANPKKWKWLKIAVLLLLFLYYYHLPEFIEFDINPKYFIRFFLYLLAGHLFVLFAPFAFTWNSPAYWNYLKNIVLSIVRSLFFSGILFLGLVLAMTAVKFLFEFDIDAKRYGQLFIICLGIVNSWIFMADFPKDIMKHTQVKYAKALEVLVSSILIPLALLYMLILYAYSIKIIVAWELPKGWVSYLVTALAFLGFLIQVLINPVQKTLKSWSINYFYPLFYLLLGPLLILLFVAISRRIADYGITENRYFVFALALWILGNTLYLLLSKKKSLRILPISLFLIAMVVSFGPWGAFTVSKTSQANQFEKVYTHIKKNNGQASGSEYEQLRSILIYLNERDAIPLLNEVTGIAIDNAFKDSTETTTRFGYLPTERILDTLNIRLDPDTIDTFGNANNYFSYYDPNEKVHSYPISEYDYFATLTHYMNEKNQSNIGPFTATFDTANTEMIISRADQKVVLTVPLKERFKRLASYNDYNAVLDQDLVFKAQNDSITAELIFTELGFNLKKDSVQINNVKAFLFLKQY
ncbi:DUF4153 domain-containing protein [Sediminicola sp. 1XM1-17]|uniref:DUF4153 domain-containing protein n=1 Tax=Sediminicola sp. 1XM1-17 TaxID=3127702 RepID=UPI00307784F8